MSEPTSEQREVLARLWNTALSFPPGTDFFEIDAAIPEQLFRLGLVVSEPDGALVAVTSLGMAYLKATDPKPPYYEWMDKTRKAALEMLLDGWKSQEHFLENVRGYLIYDGGKFNRETYNELVVRALAEHIVAGGWDKYRISQHGRNVLEAIDAFNRKFPLHVNPNLEDLKEAMKKHERAWERCMIYYHERTEQKITASMRIADKFNKSIEHAIARMRRWAAKDHPVHPSLLDDIADELEEVLGKG